MSQAAPAVPLEFSPGATISFVTPHHPSTIPVTVIRPFLPFTKSVALLVRSKELGPDDVVLKIFDPRYLDERVTRTQRQPWTLAKEKAALSLRRDVDYTFEDLLRDDVDDATRSIWWENTFQLNYRESYNNECRAYNCLLEYQGTAIPRFLFSGIIIPPDERALTPIQAIVIEYIPDALTLGSRELTADKLTPEVCGPILRALDDFPNRGVLHVDINYTNVLFAPAGRPRRGVIIDFGKCIFREDNQSHTDWINDVLTYGCDRFLRNVLMKHKGVTDTSQWPENPWLSVSGYDCSPVRPAHVFQ